MSYRSNRWQEKANRNIAKYGKQDMEALLLHSVEELGELTQAYLDYNNEFKVMPGKDYTSQITHIKDELDDLAALMYQMDAIL